MKINSLSSIVCVLVWQGLSTTSPATGKSEYEFEKTNDDYCLVWQDLFNNNDLDERN